MSDTVLGDIYAIAPKSRSIHLQGWGESLLRQDLVDIAHRIYKTGCRVTLSTNGSVPDLKQAEGLVAAGIDSMAFSLAGHDRQTHDRLKGKGTFAKALETIDTFNTARKNHPKPALVLNYLLTPENIANLRKGLSLCKKVGADTLVGTHMVHVASTVQEKMIAYNRKEQYRLTFLLARVSVLWKRVGLVLPSMKESLVPVCSKNPVQNLFVGSDGSVSPCVYLAPPLLGRYPKIYKNKVSFSKRVVMGNLGESSLEEIWARPAYRAFRDCFKRRIDLYQALMPDISPSFEGMERLEKTVKKLTQLYQTKSFQPPVPCRTCAAVNGL
jgi:MoaA/NifB/PqqE/SkfB family radical SAM enzyme